jgi:hypothetical protein
MRYAVSLVFLAACTGVHIDQIAVDDPVVNVDANAEVNATANLDTEVGLSLRDRPVAVVSADEQPAKEQAPVRVAELTVEPDAAAGEPEQAPVEPEPVVPACDDADADAVCDADDVCPGHADTDADSNGYADACEVELWSVNLGFIGSLELPDNYLEDRPAQVVIQPADGLECWLDGEGRGIAYLPVPAYSGTLEAPYEFVLPRPTEGRAGKLADCLEAGVEARAAAWLSERGGQIVANQAVPTTPGMRIAYFRVTSVAFWSNDLSPHGTQVRKFQATLTAHGY